MIGNDWSYPGSNVLLRRLPYLPYRTMSKRFFFLEDGQRHPLSIRNAAGKKYISIEHAGQESVHLNAEFPRSMVTLTIKLQCWTAQN